MAINVKTIERGALHEAKEFFWVFLYLYLCIGMLVVYKALILKTYGIEFAWYGFALVKAAILGKFILMGQALPMGRRFDQMPGRASTSKNNGWKAIAPSGLQNT